MPAPRIFVSSTYYDLRHVREIIRDFIISLGYEPVLSEFSDILYRPNDSIQNACLREIEQCDMLVLIIGHRYGSIFPGDTLSITNREYLEAFHNNIPIFSFVERDVYAEFNIWKENQQNGSIKFKVVHDHDKDIFQFIDDIILKPVNNALIQYATISDILNHLRKQWAAMFKLYLLAQDQEKVATEQKHLEALANSLDAQKRLPFFLDQLKIIGIQSLNISDILKHSTFMSLIKEKSQSIQEFETEFRVQFSDKTKYLGKEPFIQLKKDFSILRKLKEEELWSEPPK